MSETLREIERIKGEMGKLVTMALKQQPVLSESRHYDRMLQLNEQLELLYRELAYNEPAKGLSSKSQPCWLLEPAQ